jgi:hypothetical protein
MAFEGDGNRQDPIETRRRLRAAFDPAVAPPLRAVDVGTTSTLSKTIEGDSLDVGAADTAQRELLRTIQNYSRSDDPTVGASLMAVAARKSAVMALTEKKKDEEDRQWHSALHALQRQIDRYIEELDAQLAKIDEHLREIDDRLDAQDDIEKLYASGKLDLTNPAHRELLRRAGISAEEFEADPAGALARIHSQTLSEQDYWRRQRDDVVQRRDVAEDLRARADNARTPQDVEAVASDLAKLRKEGEASLLDHTTAGMSDKAKVQAIEAASGFDAKEQRQAVLTLNAGQSGFGGEADISRPQQSPLKPAP